MIPYEEYKRLRQTPMEELSEEDKKKRLDEFQRRLDLVDNLVKGLVKNKKMSKDIEEGIPGDDPLKEVISYTRIITNDENPGKA